MVIFLFVSVVFSLCVCVFFLSKLGIFLKLIQVSRIPLNIYNIIPYPFNLLANKPVSLKKIFHGLSNCEVVNYPLVSWVRCGA